jgi:hypothetical protein
MLLLSLPDLGELWLVSHLKHFCAVGPAGRKYISPYLVTGYGVIAHLQLGFTGKQ